MNNNTKKLTVNINEIPFPSLNTKKAQFKKNLEKIKFFRISN